MPRGTELRSSTRLFSSAAIGISDSHVISSIPDSRGNAFRGQPVYGAHEAPGEMTVRRASEHLRGEKHEAGWLLQGGP